jgi:ribosome-associated heat shock protein Hsp15
VAWGGLGSVSEDRQRIDKWLWHARIVRTRSAAAALAASGHVRLNGARVAAPAKAVKAGDVVTIALDARVRVLKVTGFAPRRGAADAGRALYEDLAPADPAPDPHEEPPVAPREPGRGRPTKQERRAIERFTRRRDSPDS